MRSVKPAAAFSAFVLGISLLIYSAAVCLLLLFFGGGVWSDMVWLDYQNTDSFHSYVSDRLVRLVLAAGDPGAEDPMTPGDTDLLYVVRAGGTVRFANIGTLSPDPDALPEGYNFLLVYNGEDVRVFKDGRNISLEFPVDLPQTDTRVIVYLAAAEHPSYGSGSDNSLSYLLRDLNQTRALGIWLVFLPALTGAAFTVWSILWHKYKVRADRAIAWFTGRVWLEVKLLLLIPLAFVCALAFVSCVDLFAFQRFDRLLRCLSVPVFLWWCYLYINDLRYNFGRLKEQSLCAACVRLLRRQALRYPVQRRMDRRAALQFAACLPFFLFCALSVPYLYQNWLWTGLGPIFLALLCVAGIGLIALQIWLMKENRRATADMDTLLKRVQAAGEGRLDETMPLPEDSDLRAASEQLSHMEAGLRTALAQQMKSERMKVELIANVSHDLKTPLTSIISYAELLKQEEGLPDHVKDYIRILSEKAGRLQTMVQDVFEVSKAATGNLPVAVAPLDFAKLLRQTLADLDEDVAASGLALRVRLPEEPVWIAADGDRLYRVFQNLIGNALKYSLEGSRVYLDLTVQGDTARATLRNTSRDELPDGVDLTERFVRGDASRTDGGSGLGLSIARAFTEACGGTFSVQTQADLFTATVSFPLTQARPPQEDAL